jgi:hypothetical protein
MSAVFGSNRAPALSRACRAAIDVFFWSCVEEPVKGAQAMSRSSEFYATSATEMSFVARIAAHAHVVDVLNVTHLFWLGEVVRYRGRG